MLNILCTVVSSGGTEALGRAGPSDFGRGA